MASTLLGSIDHRLPNELTLAVVEQLAHDNRTLCTLAQTCRGFQQLTEEHIYKTIKLRSVTDLRRIIAAFAARQERVRAVHSLKILYRWSDKLGVSLERRKAFNECVAQMVNLREWHIESPYDNFKWQNGGHEWVEGDMERFREALERACVDGAQEKARLAQDMNLYRNVQRTVGLAQLESLTIHSHGAHADFWNLDGFNCLFRHPSLRYLHVSCVTFPERLEVLEPHRRTTPLTTLIFDECNLETTSLRQMLSTPEKLKHLTLGENVFNIHESAELSPKLSPHPVAALEALAAVAHSLETLVHLDSKWRLNPENFRIARQRVTSDGMRQFDSLRTMECDTGSFLHEAIVMNPHVCPPNLETLIVRRHYYVAENFFDHLPDVSIYVVLPSLKTLELRQSAASFNNISTAEYICEAERLRNRHAYGYALWKSGVDFRVSIEMGRGSSLIPPYLHGEPVPEVQCVYDASAVGFRRRVDAAGGDFAHTQVLTPYHPFSPDPYIAEPASCTDTAQADLPETDQLSATDVWRLTNECGRLLGRMKRRFTRSLGPRRGDEHEDPDVDLPLSDLEDEFEGTDGTETEEEEGSEGMVEMEEEEMDSEFEALMADLQNDGDEEAFYQFVSQMQQQGIMITVESDGEGDEEGDEGDDEYVDAEEGEEEGNDGEWEDAEEELDIEADLD